MKNNSLIYLLIIFLGVGFISFKTTYSLFSDTASSIGNVFSAATSFPLPKHIVINEIYIDGNSKGEWVEIYNQKDSPVDVSGWKISDSNAYETGNDDTFPTVSPIPAHGYGVIITNQSTVTGIPSSAIIISLTNANIGSGLNDDGDAVIIKNASGSIIDKMSYGNYSPPIFPSPPAAPGLNQTLARSPNGQDTDITFDWIIDNTPSIGIEN